MKIGIIGSGEIGGSLARRLAKLGHQVSIANSRGPESLADLAAETGVKAVTVHEAARSGEVVFVAIPAWRIADLPKDLFDGVDADVAVIETGNYYPQERDGRIDPIEEGKAESRWVADQLGRPVLKAINNLHWRSLLDGGKPTGTPGRIALPVSGDDVAHKERVIRLFDELDMTVSTPARLMSPGVSSLARRCMPPISMRTASALRLPRRPPSASRSSALHPTAVSASLRRS